MSGCSQISNTVNHWQAVGATLHAGRGAWPGVSRNSVVGGAQETTERRLEHADCRQEGGNLFMSKCSQIYNKVKPWQTAPGCMAQGRCSPGLAPSTGR